MSYGRKNALFSLIVRQLAAKQTSNTLIPSTNSYSSLTQLLLYTYSDFSKVSDDNFNIWRGTSFNHFYVGRHPVEGRCQLLSKKLCLDGIF